MIGHHLCIDDPLPVLKCAAKHTSVNSQLSSNQESAQNAKQALVESDKELEQCDLERNECVNAKRDVATQL